MLFSELLAFIVFSAEFSSVKLASRPRFYCDLLRLVIAHVNTSGVLARNYPFYDNLHDGDMKW